MFSESLCFCGCQARRRTGAGGGFLHGLTLGWHTRVASDFWLRLCCGCGLLIVDVRGKGISSEPLIESCCPLHKKGGKPWIRQLCSSGSSPTGITGYIPSCLTIAVHLIMLRDVINRRCLLRVEIRTYFCGVVCCERLWRVR